MTLIGLAVSQDCRWMQRIAGQPETTTPPNEEAAWSGALVILDVVAPTAPKLPKQHQGVLHRSRRRFANGVRSTYGRLNW